MESLLESGTKEFLKKPDLEKSKIVLSGCIIGLLIPICIPFLHFGIISHLWDEFNYKVDRILCTCSCWDTIFKGNTDIKFLHM